MNKPKHAPMLGQTEASRIAMSMGALARLPSFAEQLDKVARKEGKATILQKTPTGGFLVWLTERETDPVTALLMAAVSILIQRGKMKPGERQGITIRKVAQLVTPGAEVFWSVTNQEGTETIASGYCRNEAEAALEVAKHCMGAQ